MGPLLGFLVVGTIGSDGPLRLFDAAGLESSPLPSEAIDSPSEPVFGPRLSPVFSGGTLGELPPRRHAAIVLFTALAMAFAVLRCFRAITTGKASNATKRKLSDEVSSPESECDVRNDPDTVHRAMQRTHASTLLNLKDRQNSQSRKKWLHYVRVQFFGLSRAGQHLPYAMATLLPVLVRACLIVCVYIHINICSAH